MEIAIGQAALGPRFAAGSEGREARLEQRVHPVNIFDKVIELELEIGEGERNDVLLVGLPLGNEVALLLDTRAHLEGFVVLGLGSRAEVSV